MSPMLDPVGGMKTQGSECILVCLQDEEGNVPRPTVQLGRLRGRFESHPNVCINRCTYRQEQGMNGPVRQE